MRRPIWIAFFCLAALPALAEIKLGKEDASKPYLFDVTKKDAAVRQALAALFKGEKLAPWAGQILSGGNYVAGAPRAVEAPITGATVYMHACRTIVSITGWKSSSPRTRPAPSAFSEKTASRVFWESRIRMSAPS